MKGDDCDLSSLALVLSSIRRKKEYIGHFAIESMLLPGTPEHERLTLDLLDANPPAP
jgi:hypothetical protein